MSDPTPAQTIVLCLAVLALFGGGFSLAKNRAAGVVLLAVAGVFLTIAAITTFGGAS